MKNGFLLVTCIVCMLPLNGFLGAEDSGETLVIAGEESHGVQARLLRQIYPEIRANVENALGWKLFSPPTVILITDRSVFERMSGNPLISALAIPSRRSIVFYLSPTTSEPYILNETFEHELCHLLLHEYISDGRLPKWLDEGICQWVSGSLGEILEGKGFAGRGINPARNPIPLQQLAVSFPNGKESLIQAYAESRLFVEYLVARYGKESLLSILKHLHEGSTSDQAISWATSKSLQSLQEEWLEDLRSRGVWLLWASQNLDELLFLLAAILTIAAFVRLVTRKRRYDPADEDDE